MRLPRAAWLVLLVTAVVAVAWGHVKLLSQDEIFVLQTDSVGSLAGLVQVQRTVPISLDPLVYHALAYGAMKVFGVGAFGLRLPSLLGFLGMQVGVFWFVRRWLGERAGGVAMAVPAVMATLFYAAEGRPYGLLLGLYAVVMVLWQARVRREPGHVSVVVGLAVAIALALNTHYFGVLLLVPLWGAEVWRTVARRRVDGWMVVAMAVGMVGIVGTVPFQRAAGEFRLHYYNGGTVGLRTVSQAYRTLVVDYTGLGLGAQRWVAVGLAVLAVLFVVAVVVRMRSMLGRIPSGTKAPSSFAAMRPEAKASGYPEREAGYPELELGLPVAEVVFVLLLAGLPVFGYVLARVVTHSMEVRYVLGAVMGVAVLVALVVAPWLRRDDVWRWVVVGLVMAIVVAGVVRVRGEREKSAAVMASLVPSAELKAAMAATPSGRLYFQDMGHFEVASYYEPDAWVRERMALVESRAEELCWDGHDTVSLTAEHMRGFTGFPILTYEEFRNIPGPAVMVLFHSGWDWTDDALATDPAWQEALGSAMGGDAALVRFEGTRPGEWWVRQRACRYEPRL